MGAGQESVTGATSGVRYGSHIWTAAVLWRSQREYQRQAEHNCRKNLNRLESKVSGAAPV